MDRREYDLITEITNEFNDRRAHEAIGHFSSAYTDEISVEDAGSIWSCLPICFDTPFLTDLMQQAGLGAHNIYNADAFSQEVTLAEGSVRSVRSRGHLVCRVAVGPDNYYVDPYLQQFALSLAATSADELFDVHSNTSMPEDRALIFREDQLGEVASLFAITVRNMQERIARGAWRDISDACSRKFTLVDLMMNTGVIPPMVCTPYHDLEMMAQRIWSPANYQRVSQEEIEALR